ncbi:uncharacterized protein B0H18DRAFT_502787 [Fomitopsis serialis]|uniref:uncharacterized protein n=1 Tax=Fomitopsis serialis TaxID=139415 RepID=UPI0020079D37|nr:uncharacterized protein B0H18DRAFT_502787 [Neoantrodia serialis]KAH9922745.1 hypothetical protein B0H18DRAFT_502787 [Neoantrodia serialis]
MVPSPIDHKSAFEGLRCRRATAPAQYHSVSRAVLRVYTGRCKHIATAHLKSSKKGCPYCSAALSRADGVVRHVRTACSKAPRREELARACRTARREMMVSAPSSVGMRYCSRGANDLGMLATQC